MLKGTGDLYERRFAVPPEEGNAVLLLLEKELLAKAAIQLIRNISVMNLGKAVTGTRYSLPALRVNTIRGLLQSVTVADDIEKGVTRCGKLGIFMTECAQVRRIIFNTGHWPKVDFRTGGCKIFQMVSGDIITFCSADGSPL